jgi:hypothetical protein
MQAQYPLKKTLIQKIPNVFPSEQFDFPNLEYLN